MKKRIEIKNWFSSNYKKITSSKIKPYLKIVLIFVLIICINCDNSNKRSSPKKESANLEPFFDDFDSSEIDTSVWHIATWQEHEAQTGVERCYVSGGYLNLVFRNDSTDGFLNAAIQTWKEYLYGKWEARLKPSNVSGVLNSMYTIDWNNTADNSADDNGTQQEIDIEFLTKSFASSYGEVHFAVHALNKNSFETEPDVVLDFNPSDDFHVWGFEITPEYVRWFVDDVTLLTYYYSDYDIAITKPYQLKFNVWSAVHWVGGPPASDVDCVYQIDWVRFTPLD